MNATSASRRRGAEYARQGRVRDVRITPTQITAMVAGEFDYVVKLTASSFDCTCPVGVTGEFCKHLVALAVVTQDTDVGDASESADVDPDVAPRPPPADDPPDLVETWLRGQSGDELVRLILEAAGEFEPLALRLRMAAARSVGDLSATKALIDDQLRTRRHLDWRQAMAYAHQAEPVVEELTDLVSAGQANEAIPLIERSLSLVAKTELRADDSSGAIGQLAYDLLDLHIQACELGSPDPTKLAKWLLKFGLDGQDYWNVDVVDYADALGHKGVKVYRAGVAERLRDRADHDFTVNQARQRLAIIDRDADFLVASLGGDLSAPVHFERVAKAMLELDLPDEALAWAERGIREASGWQVGRLYEIAAQIYAVGDDRESLRRTREEHLRQWPSLTTYSSLRREMGGEWSDQRETALAILADSPRKDDWIAALLSEGLIAQAWEGASAVGGAGISDSTWKTLAAARAEQGLPRDAVAVWLRLADGQLRTADRDHYRATVALLAAAAEHVGMDDPQLRGYVADVQERYRNRPTLMAMLTRAGW